MRQQSTQENFEQWKHKGACQGILGLEESFLGFLWPPLHPGQCTTGLPPQTTNRDRQIKCKVRPVPSSWKQQQQQRPTRTTKISQGNRNEWPNGTLNLFVNYLPYSGKTPMGETPPPSLTYGSSRAKVRADLLPYISHPTKQVVSLWFPRPVGSAGPRMS